MKIPDVKNMALLVLCICCFLLPRLWGLGKNWTADEKHWVERSYCFMNALSDGDYKGTVQSVHPGVITMWSLGITQRLIGYKAKDGDIPHASPDDVNESRLRQMKTGLILVCLVLYIFVFYLLRMLLGVRAGLIAALFIALDPSLAGYTRTLHLDGIYVFCGFISFLAAMLFYFRGGFAVRWAVLSGVFAGLATLNRSQGVIFPVLFLSATILLLMNMVLRKKWGWKDVRRIGLSMLFFIICYVLVIYVLFPALWSRPIASLQDVLSGGVNLVSRQHRHPLFFMGKRFYTPPGYFYRNLLYWFVMCFKLTPAVLLSFLSGILLLGFQFRSSYQVSRKNVCVNHRSDLCIFVCGTDSTKSEDNFRWSIYTTCFLDGWNVCRHLFGFDV